MHLRQLTMESSNSTNIHHDASGDDYAVWKVILWLIGAFAIFCVLNCGCQYTCKQYQNNVPSQDINIVTNPVHEETKS